MKRHHLLTKTAVIVLLLAVVITAGLLYIRPLPSLVATTSKTDNKPSTSQTIASLPWPSYGQSAVGTVDSGVLASSAEQPPVPTASVAKLMTVLAVLDKKPLAKGTTGPTLTVNAADLAVYNHYFSLGGSLVRVELGEKINQYDVLQAILMPSANNMADMLATWAFGSIDAYATYANNFAKQHGMTQTHIADASGFSPDTTSTASDLVMLGALAMHNPVIAEIVAKPTANIPVAGTIHNVNGLLGKSGINGLKTGNTDQAGGVFVVSANRQLADGHKVTVIASIMGGPDLVTTMRASLPLLDAATASMSYKTIIKKGQNFGSFTTPWSQQKIQAVASKDISVLSWPGGEQPTITASLKPLQGPQAKGTVVGTLTIDTGNKTETVPLVLADTINAPDAWWRLVRR